MLKLIDKIIYGLFFLLFSLLFFAGLNCKGEEAENRSGEDTLHRATDKIFKFKNKLFSIPSPFVTAQFLKQISAEYNSDLLSPSENKNKYVSTYDKSLNLGIYTADLAYCTMFEEYAQLSKYIKTVKAISSELLISNAYTDELLSKFEDGIVDKDTLNKIFIETYRETELYLRENNRENVFELIITGAWVESLYIMTETINEKNNKELMRRIGEQKYTLSALLNILAGINIQNEKSALLLSRLRELNTYFEQIEINYIYSDKIVFEKDKKTVLLSETDTKISPELLRKISDKIFDIRKFIIK